jgi:hypothetical protein
MKTSHFSYIPAAVVAGCALLLSTAHAQPVPPDGLTGTITALQATVLAGQKPNLNWTVNYPSVVERVVDIDPDKITPKKNLRADVRIIGQGVTGTLSGGGYFFAPTHATMSINSPSAFTSIFYGINPDVKPDEIIDLGTKLGTTYTHNLVQAGKAIRFGGYYVNGSSTGTHYKSNDGTNNVRFLKNGDIPPACVPDHGAPSLESFLAPYLNTTGKVQIGPMDVIVFMELTHSAAQQAESGYDLQDMVLLVTFSEL